MNLPELERKLFAAARLHPVDDSVPYAFERRIMARLVGLPVDHWAAWSGVFWRATAPSLAVVVLLGVLTLATRPGAAPGDSVVADLETTVYSAMDSPGEMW